MADSVSSKMRQPYSHEYYSKPGVVYFITAGDPPVAVKIGVATDERLDQRIREIQGLNHERVAVRGVFHFPKGPQDDKPMVRAEKRERELHQQFSSLRRAPAWHPGHEWFTAGPELLQFIADEARDGRMMTYEEWRVRWAKAVSDDSCRALSARDHCPHDSRARSDAAPSALHPGGRRCSTSGSC